MISSILGVGGGGMPMASLQIFNSISPAASPPPARATLRPSGVQFSRGTLQFYRNNNKTRGLRSVVTRAGPSTGSYVFAFVLPISLLAITVFASLKLDDKLERQYLEELILNEAMKEQEEEDEKEEDDDDRGDAEVFLKEKLQEATLPRSRNRPKRAV